MYRHVLSLLAGTMVAFAMASTAPVTWAQDELSEADLEPLPSEQIRLQEYNLRLSGFAGAKFLQADNDSITTPGSIVDQSAVLTDADRQLVIGGELEWNLEGYNNMELPLSLVLAIAISNSDDDEDVITTVPLVVNREEDIEVMEIRLGVRATFDSPILNDFNRSHLYIGTGIAWARAEVDTTVQLSTGPPVPVFDNNESGDGFGYWVGGGMYWDVFNNVTFGVDVTFSEIEIDGGPLNDFDAGGLSITATLGIKF